LDSSFRVSAFSSASAEKQSAAFAAGIRNFQISDLFPRLKAEGRATGAGCRAEEKFMSLGTIILIILVIALLGGFSGIGGGPFYGTGYYGGGGLGLVVVILLILLLLGRL
jgi:hypothetical protein